MPCSKISANIFRMIKISRFQKSKIYKRLSITPQITKKNSDSNKMYLTMWKMNAHKEG